MFSIHSAKADGGHLTLSVAGELDFTNGYQLHEAVTAALTTPGIRDLVIDLDDLRFMDSVGISTLLAGWRQAHTQGTTFRIARPTRSVTQILETTGTLTLLAGEMP
jgi:anti-sigma B factor antagonist